MAAQQKYSRRQCNGENVGDANVKWPPLPVGRVAETGVKLCRRDVFGRRHKRGGRAAALVEHPDGDGKTVNVTAIHVFAGAAGSKVDARGHAQHLSVGYPARGLARLVANENSSAVSAGAKTGASNREHAASVAGADAGCD